MASMSLRLFCREPSFVTKLVSFARALNSLAYYILRKSRNRKNRPRRSRRAAASLGMELLMRGIQLLRNDCKTKKFRAGNVCNPTTCFTYKSCIHLVVAYLHHLNSAILKPNILPDVTDLGVLPRLPCLAILAASRVPSKIL